MGMIANRVREFREKKMAESLTPSLWTQEALSGRVGVTRQTMISIEKGSYNPSLELAFKLARELTVSIEELFEYKTEEK
jgi:putative transcriptional regulator